MSKLHSVSLVPEKCKGCTACLKRCPTEAIRIRNGRAVILTERCIDCGECIRVCPHKAKKATYDDFSALGNYKWNIALPAPALYGQFDNLEDVDFVLTGLLGCGFDDVYEVACAAELISEYTRRYLRRTDIPKPVISSACPAVARIIAARFPTLCANVMPMLPPVEMAAILAREEAKANHPELTDEEIGVFFISPCPAKVSYVKNPIGIEKSAISGALSMSDVYFRLLPVMRNITTPKSLSRTGLIGISWAGTGGESSALFNDKYLAADGIENVIQVLDEIENGNISGLEFVELNACSGGCVGGALTVVNPYISKARLQSLRRYLPVSQNRVGPALGGDQTEIPSEYLWNVPLKYTPNLQLDSDITSAMRKMSEIQRIRDHLPDLDCGACGAPSCFALAEDVVCGMACERDCIMKWKDVLRTLDPEMPLPKRDKKP